MSTETWMVIPSTMGCYEASSHGRIRRSTADLGGTYIGRIRVLFVQPNGYLALNLSINGEHFRRLVHRLVAEAFFGPAPEGKAVNHKDGNKLNNQIDNLEYTTHSENIRHSIDVLGQRVGENHPRSKLTDDAVRGIRVEVAGGATYREVAARYNVHISTVSFIINRRTWTHVK